MNNPHRTVAAPGPRHGAGTPGNRCPGGRDGLAMISPAARQTEPWEHLGETTDMVPAMTGNRRSARGAWLLAKRAPDAITIVLTLAVSGRYLLVHSASLMTGFPGRGAGDIQSAAARES